MAPQVEIRINIAACVQHDRREDRTGDGNNGAVNRGDTHVIRCPPARLETISAGRMTDSVRESCRAYTRQFDPSVSLWAHANAPITFASFRVVLPFVITSTTVIFPRDVFAGQFLFGADKSPRSTAWAQWRLHGMCRGASYLPHRNTPAFDVASVLATSHTVIISLVCA